MLFCLLSSPPIELCVSVFSWLGLNRNCRLSSLLWLFRFISTKSKIVLIVCQNSSSQRRQMQPSVFFLAWRIHDESLGSCWNHGLQESDMTYLTKHYHHHHFPSTFWAGVCSAEVSKSSVKCQKPPLCWGLGWGWSGVGIKGGGHLEFGWVSGPAAYSNFMPSVFCALSHGRRPLVAPCLQIKKRTSSRLKIDPKCCLMKFTSLAQKQEIYLHTFLISTVKQVFNPGLWICTAGSRTSL